MKGHDFIYEGPKLVVNIAKKLCMHKDSMTLEKSLHRNILLSGMKRILNHKFQSLLYTLVIFTSLIYKMTIP